MMLSATPTLLELFENHEGRVIHKFPHHLEIYSKLFKPFRYSYDTTLLEIGIADGGSLQLWRQYFGGSAVIIGVDIQDKTGLAEETESQILVGDQGNQNFWRMALPQIGHPNIIIDDGSHMCSDQIITFEELFPNLADGGLYIVEDIHTSYRQEYGGGLRYPLSFVEYLKSLVDDLHLSEHLSHPPTTSIDHLFSIQIYPNLAVIEKRHPSTWGGSTMRPA